MTKDDEDDDEVKTYIVVVTHKQITFILNQDGIVFGLQVVV